MPRAEKHFGYKPNPAGVEAYLNETDNLHPTFGLAGHELLAKAEKKTVLLYEPLLALHPNWKRGAQGIGDCVSWGFELGCTTLMAVDIVLRGQAEQWKGEAATESIYGGARVEASGVRRGGWGDGSYGGVAAKWVRKWGVLLRADYSKKTGNDEHDLRRYSSKKAKDWGNYGCGGQRDDTGDGPLDKIAREHPVKTTSLVVNFEEAAAAISNGYPVPVCSGQGFSSSRDNDGFCRARGSWSHCMLFWGVRFGRRPGLLCANSWGHSVDGTRWPKKMPDSVAACSWWVDADVATRMLRGQDSFAMSGFEGFKRRQVDWADI